MVFNLYRCNGKVFLSNNAKMVCEHVNRGYDKKAPVKQMPTGSVGDFPKNCVTAYNPIIGE